VDDETLLLFMTAEMLKSAGFQVETEETGEAALERLHRKQYDLILCDWKMPGLSGQEFYQRLATGDPEAASRVVFMTGDVSGFKSKEFFRSRNLDCLAKPFTMADLNEAVKNHSSQSVST